MQALNELYKSKSTRDFSQKLEQGFEECKLNSTGPAWAKITLTNVKIVVKREKTDPATEKSIQEKDSRTSQTNYIVGKQVL